MSDALTIGKFYPPHLGHLDLIARAAHEADRVTVLVMASGAESVALADRVAWLREATAAMPGVQVVGMPDDAPVDYGSELAWVAQTAHMRAALDAAGVGALDLVVGSEPYITEMAVRLGARAILHDPERRRVPISSTAIRADPAGTWALLPEPVRRGLAVRIIVVGAESTGTTTLATALQAHYRTHGYPVIADVPEYGREFTYVLHERTAAEAARTGAPPPTMHDLVWLPEHFAEIARRQTELENAASLAAPVVIADTDALATTIWERRYVGPDSRASAIALADLPRRDLYLVTDHVGVPFEQDGWRDGEHLREGMTAEFIATLQERGVSWILLRGDRDERLQYAISAIDPIIDRRLRFAAPLPQAGVGA